MDNDVEKVKEVILSFWEYLPRVLPTAFPIEDYTVRTKLINMSHHLLGGVILGITLIGLNQARYIPCRRLID